MSERTYTDPEADRAGWPAGPWDDEPDKISWTDEATGRPCLIVRGPAHSGHLCGYVAVDPGHPFHGKRYDDPPVDVHGGLTYADSCNEDDSIESGICHVPEPGKPADVWWFGFDCAHAWDLSPARLARKADWYTPERIARQEASYKTVEFVRGECRGLARQLQALSTFPDLVAPAGGEGT